MDWVIVYMNDMNGEYPKGQHREYPKEYLRGTLYFTLTLDLFGRLINLLLEAGRVDDAKKASTDKAARDRLLREFNLIDIEANNKP